MGGEELDNGVGLRTGVGQAGWYQEGVDGDDQDGEAESGESGDP
ncbi:hypothetical protein ACQRWP_06860 [Micromonospora trifolii]